MNKSELKNFAINARLELIGRVADRAAQYGIAEETVKRNAIVPSASFQKLGGVLLTREEIRQRDALLRRVAERGYRQAMEEAAYTWFNRFIALRYMQEHNLLPVDVRVLPAFAGETPQLVTEAHNVEINSVDAQAVADMISASETDALYKYLLIALCNQLSGPLPQMFERISDYTELLFPDGILREDSVLGMLAKLGGDNWREIQAIGWLYQYYNTELKQETFDLLKKNVKITKDRVGAATQLFTPEWIVNYMVENSLGRLWLEGHPDKNLRMKWRYYMDEAEQEPEVAAKLAQIRKERESVTPEQITLLDPCMGSGHILVYAFDVLMDIYRSVGYTDRDAVKSIVENNLYGLDIDDRAAQLAYFAVMMKACEYDRRFLRRGVQPHVCAIQESNSLEAFTRLRGQMRLNTLCLDAANGLIDAFRDAKEYGSILSPAIDSLSSVDDLMRQLEDVSLSDMEIQNWYESAKPLLPQLAGQALIMQRKYDVVVTNPPYMGSSGMSAKLSQYVKDWYPDSKSDLFAVFIERCGAMVKASGFSCMVTMQSWMFLSSFETMRTKILQTRTITNLLHMDNMVMGIAFGTAVSNLRGVHIYGYKGRYNHITMADIEDGKPVKFPVNNRRDTTAQQDNFSKIPGAPVAYWVGPAMLRAFDEFNLFGEIARIAKGLVTANNDQYVRLWYEVCLGRVGFNYENRKTAIQSEMTWFPYAKGGAFRRWYGNFDFLVNWENDGFSIQNTLTEDGSRVRATNFNLDRIFKKGISWTVVTSGAQSFRLCPNGFLFDAAAGICQPEKVFYKALGFLNSSVADIFLKTVNPTLNLHPGYIECLPFDTKSNNKSIEEIVCQCVSLSAADYDSYEISWNFVNHPLM